MGPRTSGSLSFQNKQRVSKHSAPAQVVEGPPSQSHSNLFVSTVDTPNGDTTDQLKQKTINMAVKVMKC